MPRPKMFKNPKRVSVVMDESLYRHIEKQAIYMSSEEGKILSINEMIRRAIETCYPQPKQEMFKF